MHYKTEAITATVYDAVYTEVLFHIACARAEGVDVLCLTVRRDLPAAPKVTAHIEKTLRQFKRRGLLQMFVTRTGLSEGSTECSYLLNKYPDVADTAEYGDACVEPFYIRP